MFTSLLRTFIVQDPYFMRNHLGTYECKLCLTLHNNEASYLAHTQVRQQMIVTFLTMSFPGQKASEQLG